MFKTTVDIVSVWMVTLIATVGTSLIDVLPVVQNFVAIISILIAISYTLYRFARSWTGFRPWLNKDGTNRNVDRNKDENASE